MDLARVVADAVLGASADAVVATDDKGIIRLWNPGAERAKGQFDLSPGGLVQCRKLAGFRQACKKETGPMGPVSVCLADTAISVGPRAAPSG